MTSSLRRLLIMLDFDMDYLHMYWGHEYARKGAYQIEKRQAHVGPCLLDMASIKSMRLNPHKMVLGRMFLQCLRV